MGLASRLPTHPQPNWLPTSPASRAQLDTRGELARALKTPRHILPTSFEASEVDTSG